MSEENEPNILIDCEQFSIIKNSAEQKVLIIKTDETINLVRNCINYYVNTKMYSGKLSKADKRTLTTMLYNLLEN